MKMRVAMERFGWCCGEPAVAIRKLENKMEIVLIITPDGEVAVLHDLCDIRIVYKSQTGRTGEGYLLYPYTWKELNVEVKFIDTIDYAKGTVFTRLVPISSLPVIIFHDGEDPEDWELLEKVEGLPTCRAILKGGTRVVNLWRVRGVRILPEGISPEDVVAVEILPNVWRVREYGTGAESLGEGFTQLAEVHQVSIR